LEFSYPTFDTANQADFSFSPGSGIANGSLQITPTTGNISGRSGRVCYARETLNLWNSNMTAPASFFTEFMLNIQPQNGTVGEGMAFILTNSPALPSDSSGQWLGITNNQTDGATTNRVVAVEFDTRKSFKDDPDGNHVGIDINSISSTYWYPLSNLSIVLSSGSDVWVRIEYDGTAAKLRIQAVQKGLTFEYFWPLDLSRHLLLENLTLGFAASTGDFTALNQIKSWNFSTPGADTATESKLGHRNRRKLTLVFALLGLFLIALSSSLVFFIWRRMTGQRRLAYRNLEKMIDAHGPVRFNLRELRSATANFSPARKLGHGGFGTVYLGYLQRMTMNIEVAVKRVSTTGNSSRGEQEFLAEVNTISKLSHRNLVKLIGWCHQRGELLLVYEYFSMGSLDRHLYTGERSAAASTQATTAAASPELTWDRRYKIICGVASALEYLHHGSSRRILHRDVKASNVMLDEEHNARLGDFGLARVIERDGVTHHSTQAVAGTRAYMAQESFFTGRATLATDVFAFGVFVMEVISGRRPSSPVLYGNVNGDQRDEPSRSRRGRHRQQQQPMYIVDWTWRLYGEGRALHAADGAVLNNGAELDPAQVERAVRLALACCHPNPRERPSMRTAVQVLIGGAKAPEPPFHKPAFVWPPRGDEAPEIELPDVGLLFTGGQTTYCSLSCSSFSGR
jgi:interleukin-1 receptor-associated kinase 1